MSDVSWSKKSWFSKPETRKATDVKVEKASNSQDNIASLKAKAKADRMPSAVVQMGNDVLLLSSPDLVTKSEHAQTPDPAIKKGSEVMVDGEAAKVLYTDDGFSEIDASNVTVAVIDDGFDINHPNYEDRVTHPYNAVTGTDKVNEELHGTHVAGIAVGKETGIANNATLMPISVGKGYGSIHPRDVATAVRYAADNGAKVINMSLGASESDLKDLKMWQEVPELAEAIRYAQSKGAVVICAAGNDGSSDTSHYYPAAFDGVVCVGAMSGSGLASFSNRGERLDVTAPGSNILSSVPNGKYKLESGTSMASPYVAGTAALIFAEHPDWTPEQVVRQLKWAVTDFGDPGKDNTFGYGEVNLFKAVYGTPGSSDPQ